MRRWFAIALLVLMPFQSSWAAVAAYCAHEASAQSLHFGHHEHPHAGAGSPAGAAPADIDGDPLAQTNGPAGQDVECDHCLGNCCSLPATVTGLKLAVDALHPAPHRQGILRTWAQSPPERPQWLHLA
jgi:hypothetical protein